MALLEHCLPSVAAGEPRQVVGFENFSRPGQAQTAVWVRDDAPGVTLIDAVPGRLCSASLSGPRSADVARSVLMDHRFGDGGQFGEGERVTTQDGPMLVFRRLLGGGRQVIATMDLENTDGQTTVSVLASEA
ncbi:MAG: hypothetical protein AAGE18_16900 [Pseudomonadota bacterium]